MPNRLASATSQYLRQHADNPVDWWNWGPEAFAEAARRDVLVLVSIGYSSCHWCHVMARETFADAEVGSLQAGKRADFVVPAEDPLAVPGAELRALTVLATYVDGQPVYEATGSGSAAAP